MNFKHFFVLKVERMETDVAVMAERRAKMAKLRSEHFVAGREVTSAPRVTSVDEFSQVRD